MRGAPNIGTPRIILHRKHQAISISGSMTLLGTVTISSPKAVDILQMVDSVRLCVSDSQIFFRCLFYQVF